MSENDPFAERADAPTAMPAATVVVFRHDPAGGPAQLLLVERAGTMVFAGGATVFPGGKVDPADHDLAQELIAGGVTGFDPDDLAGRIAAVREAIEETGLVVGVKESVTSELAAEARRLLIENGNLAATLAAFGWTLDPDALVPFARWRPRHHHSRIFDTRFYLADLGTGAVDVAADATESQHLFWASAAEALRLADAGRIKIIFPTRRNLERLAQFNDFAECRRHAQETPTDVISPEIVERDGARWLIIPSGAGYPVVGELLEDAMRG